MSASHLGKVGKLDFVGCFCSPICTLGIHAHFHQCIPLGFPQCLSQCHAEGSEGAPQLMPADWHPLSNCCGRLLLRWSARLLTVFRKSSSSRTLSALAAQAILSPLFEAFHSFQDGFATLHRHPLPSSLSTCRSSTFFGKGGPTLSGLSLAAPSLLDIPACYHVCSLACRP